MNINKEIWAEKYRPEKVSDIIGQQHIKDNLQKFVEDKSFPHLLFYGMQGIGKTTAAIALTKQILGSFWKQNFMELNASDERGIGTVRNKIKIFAQTVPYNNDFRVILLDEADALTADAQNALRRIMEIYSKRCKFILCCNEITKIIAPIQSRCVVYRFLPPEPKDIYERLKEICVMENINYDENALKLIAKLSFGDVRSAICKLQSSVVDNKINIESVEKSEFEKEVLELYQALFVMRDFKNSLNIYKKYLKAGGDERELLYKIFNLVINSDMTDERKFEAVKSIKETDEALINSVNNQIAFTWFIVKICEDKNEDRI
ncbi:MAG: replication factor C small subunit [Candidatus Heimdallarchaeaceae archaeon]